MFAQLKGSRSRSSSRARVGLAGLVLAVVAALFVFMPQADVVRAEDAKTLAHAAVVEVAPLLTESERKIEAELIRPTSIDFQGTPLQGALDYLKDLHQIEIQLDKKALDDAGIDHETQLTRSLKGISLRSALRLVLGEHGLAAIISDEVLLITTTDAASNSLMTRTYPVGDLVEDNDYSNLIQVFTETVKPLTWEEEGGNGRLSTVKSLKSLVISQTQGVHDEILQLLRSLRSVRNASGVALSSK